MASKFTNDFTIMKDIIKTEYTFILALLFTNFDEIIHLLKEKQPLHGEILEYLYLSFPTYYSAKHDKICQTYTYIDSVIRVLYKRHQKRLCPKFKQCIKEICANFHIEENELEYYYFVALLIIYLESSINVDAYNLYTQIDESIIEHVAIFLEDLMRTFNKTEFQCLFYNHLEDVYENNQSMDKKVSCIHKDNYSYFLDNLSNIILFGSCLPVISGKRYPIIITDEFIYNVIDNKPQMLQANNIKLPIFEESIRYVACYYPLDHTIRNWIPFFDFYKKYPKFDLNLLSALYNEYEVPYQIIDIDLLRQSQNFAIYDSDIRNIHYYISNFTVYAL